MGTFRLQMPQLGETVEEGTVVTWLKGPGDRVRVDEPLLEVATDKVDTEVPSTVDGVVDRVLVDEGETVAVGSVLAEIALDSPGADVETAPSGDAATTETEAKPARPPSERASASSTEADLRLSPVVSRLLGEHGLDPAELSRFNEGRRITRKTVEAYLERHGAPEGAEPDVADGAPAGKAPDVAEAAPGVPAETVPGAPAEAAPAGRPETPADAQVVPFSRLRKRTAEHMVRSKAVSPHVLSVMEVDFEEVERLRLERRDAFHREHGVNLTLLPFVASALVSALAEFPRLNASVGDDALVLHPTVNLGIAVDVDGEGLIAPVIKDASRLPLPRLAAYAADLAERARGGKLTVDDVSDGTFTLSNQGPYGTLLTAPIINQPQVAIVSLDGVRKRPVVVEHPDSDERDEIAVHRTGCLAMSWDHRAVDGVYAAAFLRRVRREIETRAWSRDLG